MTDPDPRLALFLDLATRPLEDDPETRDEARNELMVRLASEADAESAAALLKDRKPGRPGLYPILAFSALLILGTVAGFLTRDLVKGVVSLSQLQSSYLDADDLKVTAIAEEDFVTARLDSDADAVLQNLERLIEKRPDDPGLFEEYTGCRIARMHALPPNFRETWQRIDPGNGAWLLREAMMKASDAFKGNGGSGPVTDEAAFTRALDLLKQAADAKRFELHSADLRRRRIAQLPAPETLAGEMSTLTFVFFNLGSSLNRSPQFVGALIAERAKRLTAAKDTAGVRDLIATWRHLAHGMGTRSSTLLDSVVALGFVARGQEALRQATIDLGMTEEEKGLDAVQDITSKASTIFRGSPDRKQLSFLAGGSGLSSPPPDLMADPSLFEPGRQVEFAAADQAFALAAALLSLLLLAIVGVEMIRRGRMLNGLADGLAPLFRPADTAWIGGLGLLLPAALYWGITRLTPFGCRDIGLLYYPLPPAALQALAGLLLVILTLLQVIQWRLALRTGFLGVRQDRPWIGWTVIVLTALLIPAIGGVRWLSGDGVDYLKAMAAACGIPLLWLLWQAGLILFVPRSGALGGVLLGRQTILPLSLLIGALLAAIPLLRGIERAALQQDQLGRVDRQSGGSTLAEDQAVRWIANLFEEALGPQN